MSAAGPAARGARPMALSMGMALSLDRTIGGMALLLLRICANVRYVRPPEKSSSTPHASDCASSPGYPIYVRARDHRDPQTAYTGL